MAGKLTLFYQRTVLENGLRVLITPIPRSPSVSIQVFVGTGSRHETPEQAGISHFIEHMCFKGTPKRPTAKAISEAIEAVGGILNAATEKELTVYWSKVASPHFALGLDLLMDLVRRPLMEPQEIEKERLVILEELKMSRDLPSYRAAALVDQVLWPDHPLGRDVVGLEETISNIHREMLLEYMAQRYIPRNTVVSIAGDITPEEGVAAVASAFSDWSSLEPVPRPQPSPSPEGPGAAAPSHPTTACRRGEARVEYRKTHQAHLCLGFHGLPLVHPQRYALDLLSVLLGEGMSSRLFVELRENQGLVYDIHSYVNHFLDSGSLVIYMGVDPQKADQALACVLRELERLQEGIPEGEVSKAKETWKGRLLLRLEDSRNVASWLGTQEVLLGRVFTVDEVMAQIDAVTPEAMQRVAEELLTPERLNLAVVGPFRSPRRFQSFLK